MTTAANYTGGGGGGTEELDFTLIFGEDGPQQQPLGSAGGCVGGWCASPDGPPVTIDRPTHSGVSVLDAAVEAYLG
ncbi:hypothetical protein NHX12_006173, partial [Muraenolepis orangiensis]